MDIRKTLKEREKKSYRKMSRGMKLKLAIELSELVLKLRKVRWAKPTLLY